MLEFGGTEVTMTVNKSWFVRPRYYVLSLRDAESDLSRIGQAIN